MFHYSHAGQKIIIRKYLWKLRRKLNAVNINNSYVSYYNATCYIHVVGQHETTNQTKKNNHDSLI